jgi:hypothetical protein
MVEDTFTPAERELAAAKFRPMRMSLSDDGSNNALTLTTGSLISTTQTPRGFLGDLSGWFRRGDPVEASIRQRIEAKVHELFLAAEDEGATFPAKGVYRGRHYTEYVEPIKQLKRDGQLDEAANLLRALLPVVVGEAAKDGWAPAPWYFEQLAIVEAKRGNLVGELDACDAYLAAIPETCDPSAIASFEKRRDKARRKLQSAS